MECVKKYFIENKVLGVGHYSPNDEYPIINQKIDIMSRECEDNPEKFGIKDGVIVDEWLFKKGIKEVLNIPPLLTM